MRLSIAALLFSAILSASHALVITQYGITWTISEDNKTGQYANGDYWVVGPVTITDISPRSTLINGRTMHGSMVNPNAQPFAANGFDSTLAGYVATLNVARPSGKDLSAQNPLILQAGSSLISSITVAAPAARPQLSDAAVLTIVDSVPPVGSFRPPYCGKDKAPRWNKSALDYGVLQSLLPVAGTPTLDSVTNSFTRPWIEVNTEYTGREWHPSNNQPIYGRDMAMALGEGLLSLNLNYTNAQKEVLFVRLVQYGLDVYGAANTGGIWTANGGHDAGRKLPLILAGLALHDPAILQYGDASKHFIFQEDQQTFVVDEAELLVVPYTGDGRQRDPYTRPMLGTPEWGEKHAAQKVRDGSNWSAYYRNINYTSLLSHALAARLITGVMKTWNWPVFFDYHDRVRTIASDSEFSPFVNNMWKAYRGGIPASPPQNATITVTVTP